MDGNRLWRRNMGMGEKGRRGMDRKRKEKNTTKARVESARDRGAKTRGSTKGRDHSQCKKRFTKGRKMEEN